MSDPSICPCDTVVHPAPIANPPGLAAVAYRAGDFRSFRHALLQPLPGEDALTAWRPMPRGDLALQIIEWFAYIADVLAFYNERSLNANLLSTALRDADVRGLVRILGYRPRPGIGARATVAALLATPRPLQLPAGFAIQSTPAPGKAPQTFETTAPVTLSMPDAVPANPPGLLAGPSSRLYLEGTVTAIAAGDVLVFAPKGSFTGAVLITVQSVVHQKDSADRAYTEIVPSGAPSLPAADAAGYRVLRSRASTGLWKYNTNNNLVSSPLELEGVSRGIGAGQIVVITAPGTSLGLALLNVTATTEQIWYTNGEDSVPPTTETPMGAPHTRVSWTASPSIDTVAWNDEASSIVVLIDWTPAGTLRNTPAGTYAGTPMTLVAEGGASFRVATESTVIIEDAEGNGVAATASVEASTPSQMTIASFDVTPVPPLKTPLRVLHNVVALTRGKTIAAEQLGTGDASVQFQEFVLKKSPLTYLPAGDSYVSTLKLYVDGVQWIEVPSFYQQPPTAQVFITSEDDEQKTHVKGGDGVNGALFPTGASIVAAYRVESGLDAPGPAALTTIVKPLPGLRSVRSPIAAGGGADPDPRDQIRTYAPRGVLTFGRAISAGDYEAIAAGAPSVTRVRAYYAWNPDEQRAAVTLYVGDTAAAVESAQNALLVSADPNRPVTVLQASGVEAVLLVAVRVQPGRVLDDVVAAVRTALTDPDTGLAGERRTGIGESLYFSQISEVCERVPGVESLNGAVFYLPRPDPQTGLTIVLTPRINAAQGEYLYVTPESLVIYPTVLTSV